MKSASVKKRLASALAAAMIMFSGTAWAEPALTENSLELGKSRVAYPVVQGLNPAEEKEINRTLTEDAHVAEYLTRMSQLISSGWIQTTWHGQIIENLLSVSLLAEGMVETTKETSVWTAVNLDLLSGRRIAWRELFVDPKAAETAITDYLEETVSPELSPMLPAGRTTPIPDDYRMDETGLTLLYPVGQLSTLHDRAGDVHLAWCEIEALLRLDPGGILDRLGVPKMIRLSADSDALIRDMAASGSLPGLPLKIGERLKPLTDRYHLATDPDVYEGGRMFSLEGGCFRGIYVLTDFLSEEWDQSVVQGIRADRGNFSGLCVGKTQKTEWRSLLGEPDYSIEWDEEKAELNRNLQGTCDYYSCGSCQLRLLSDLDGTLRSVILMEQE
ncbi:MAG: hypothetical protein IJI21_03325 [Clostridia bacterium]|nr:hypothetical protein [Clostridia bacterium]